VAAYPMTNADKASKSLPLAGITSTFADDDTLKFRRDQASVHYQINIIHGWITRAQFNALLDFIVTNGYGPHTFTLKGIDYSGTLTNEPAELEQEGQLFKVESLFLATKV